MRVILLFVMFLHPPVDHRRPWPPIRRGGLVVHDPPGRLCWIGLRSIGATTTAALGRPSHSDPESVPEWTLANPQRDDESEIGIGSCELAHLELSHLEDGSTVRTGEARQQALVLDRANDISFENFICRLRRIDRDPGHLWRDLVRDTPQRNDPFGM